MKHAISLNQSATRALAVLEYLATADAPRDLAVISADLGMHKSTTFRFLSTLVAEGYACQDAGTGRYYLGPKVTWLASKFLEKLEIIKTARPILEELSAATGETTHLAILDHDKVVYVDKHEGRQAVRMAAHTGDRMPVHSTSLGKVLLADLPETAWERYVQTPGLAPRTPNTIVAAAEFYKELRRVRLHGYALDNMENEEGIRCIAAPVRDHTGRVVAALSISSWTVSMTLERAQNLVPRLSEAALTLSCQLGFQEPTHTAVKSLSKG